MENSNGNHKSGQTLIFLYGTLKRGFPNHFLIEDLIRSNDAVPISAFETLEHLPLVVGPLAIPYLLNFPGSGQRVRGELYAVTARGLARLDELEGISYGHYERLPIRVEPRGGGDVVDAEAYFGHRSFAAEMWRRSGGAAVEEYAHEDAAAYVKPEDRPAGLNFVDNIRAYVAACD